jgi:hypothetical protein
LYWPPGHAAQELCSAALWKRPAAQLVHEAADAAAYWPVGQTAALVAEAAQALPAGQALQLDAPVVRSWYVPAAQAAQLLAPVTLA